MVNKLLINQPGGAKQKEILQVTNIVVKIVEKKTASNKKSLIHVNYQKQSYKTGIAIIK